MRLRLGYAVVPAYEMYVAVPVDTDNVSYHGMIRMNDVGKKLWDIFQEDVTKQFASEELSLYFKVPLSIAQDAVESFIETMCDKNLFERR